MRISVEAKLGMRAALAVIIALCICHIFGLQRAYWAVLTALALITQSWGESIQKAYTRFGMTIAGCVVGYAVFLLAGHPQWLVLSCLLIGIFGMAYFFVVSYAWAMFFLGLIVVGVFMYLGLWSLELLWERIYETAIGCIVASVVTGLFMPVYATQGFYQNLQKALEGFITQLKKTLPAQDGNEAICPIGNLQHLNTLFLQIKNLSKDYANAKYEMIILLQEYKAMDLFLHKFEIGFHYLSSLTGILRVLVKEPIAKHFEDEIYAFLDHLESMAQNVLALLEKQKISGWQNWDDKAVSAFMREKFIQAKCQHRFSTDEMLHLTACIYYGRMLDRTLNEMIELLKGEKGASD